MNNSGQSPVPRLTNSIVYAIDRQTTTKKLIRALACFKFKRNPDQQHDLLTDCLLWTKADALITDATNLPRLIKSGLMKKHRQGKAFEFVATPDLEDKLHR